MLSVPLALRRRFEEYLRSRAVPAPEQAAYFKWLRYYLDFCGKYHYPRERDGSLPAFLHKLEEKGQTPAQRQQAAAAIRLYYQLSRSGTTQPDGSLSPRNSHAGGNTDDSHELPVPAPNNPFQVDSAVAACPESNRLAPSGKTASAATSPKAATGVSWKEQYTALTEAIKLRHYSPKTLKNYRKWVQRLQTFTKSRDPLSLSAADVKEFLTFLAVTKKVSASTQNQAFNALLFFYRHVLDKEFGKMEGIVRAKRKPYIPVVLSRVEVDAVLKHLSAPYDLVVKLLYGCGLRLFECLNLRVHCFNFDMAILTIHDGKGQKDRTVPLPKTIMPELLAQTEALKTLHRHDLARNYAGVFLVNALEKKYKNAAQEFAWQWYFPAIQLTYLRSSASRFAHS